MTALAFVSILRFVAAEAGGGKLPEAEGRDMRKKAKQKNPKQRKKKIAAKPKLSAKRKAPKRKATRAARRTPARQRQVALGSQNVDSVQLKPRTRVSASGTGGGDFGGVSVVASADSESPEELLEEGQTFEAGIVAGVENAPDPDQGEVRTREVPEDDVPEEYEDRDNS